MYYAVTTGYLKRFHVRKNVDDRIELSPLSAQRRPLFKALRFAIDPLLNNDSAPRLRVFAKSLNDFEQQCRGGGRLRCVLS